MNKYRGICVGGVADGIWQERDDPNMTVKQMQRAPNARNPEGGPAPDKELGHTDYKFLLLLGTNNAEIGVWTPQGVTIEQVVTRLVQFYNPKGSKLIGSPPLNG